MRKLLFVFFLIGCGGGSINGTYSASVIDDTETGGDCSPALKEWIEDNIGFADFSTDDIVLKDETSSLTLSTQGVEVTLDKAESLYASADEYGDSVDGCTYAELFVIAFDPDKNELAVVDSLTVGFNSDNSCPFLSDDCAYSTTYKLEKK